MGAAAYQLTLDGREVAHPAPSGTRPPLGAAQREVMRALGFGSLTSTQAGTIVHRVRVERGGSCPRNLGSARNDRYHSAYAGSGCCRFAASDGTAVMARLLRRGYVEKVFGLWFAKS